MSIMKLNNSESIIATMTSIPKLENILGFDIQSYVKEYGYSHFRCHESQKLWFVYICITICQKIIRNPVITRKIWCKNSYESLIAHHIADFFGLLHATVDILTERDVSAKKRRYRRRYEDRDYHWHDDKLSLPRAVRIMSKIISQLLQMHTVNDSTITSIMLSFLA